MSNTDKWLKKYRYFNEINKKPILLLIMIH